MARGPRIAKCEQNECRMTCTPECPLSCGSASPPSSGTPCCVVRSMCPIGAAGTPLRDDRCEDSRLAKIRTLYTFREICRTGAFAEDTAIEPRVRSWNSFTYLQ